MTKKKSKTYYAVINFLAFLVLVCILIAPFKAWYFLSAFMIIILLLIVVYANEDKNDKDN